MITRTELLALAQAAKTTSVEQVVEDNFEELFDYYVQTQQIPYEDAKDDPYSWIQVQLTKEV